MQAVEERTLFEHDALVGPVSDLGLYLWNEKVLSNYFCKSCGIFTYIGDGENAKNGYRVNLGCIEGLDALALEISIIDGKTLPVIEEPG